MLFYQIPRWLSIPFLKKIEIRFYKPGILLADDASDEEVDAAYEKVREGRFIERVQIEVSKFRYPSFVLCDFRK